jgi:hypothetical protein
MGFARRRQREVNTYYFVSGIDSASGSNGRVDSAG